MWRLGASLRSSSPARASLAQQRTFEAIDYETFPFHSRFAHQHAVAEVSMQCNQEGSTASDASAGIGTLQGNTIGLMSDGKLCAGQALGKYACVRQKNKFADHAKAVVDRIDGSGTLE